MTLIWVLMAITVVLTGIAQVGLKVGVQHFLVRASETSGVVNLVFALLSTWQLIGALALYGVATVSWLFVLSRLPLSVAYPFVGFSFVVVAVLSMFVLGEKIVFLQLVGTILVAIGVVLIAVSGQAHVYNPPVAHSGDKP